MRCGELLRIQLERKTPMKKYLGTVCATSQSQQAVQHPAIAIGQHVELTHGALCHITTQAQTSTAIIATTTPGASHREVEVA